MQILSKETKFAHLGKPGTIFSKGFQRRLDILKTLVVFQDKKILDVGTGLGVWLHKFAEMTDPANVYGLEYDPELAVEAKKRLSIPENILIGGAEQMPFADNFFDIVFSNEVLEHVQDDRKAVQEMLRVLKPGGVVIAFTPNRGWPFEQHGMFLNGKYIWGNIPLLPWMPRYIRQKFSPHVKNYSNADIKRLFAGLPGEFIYHKHVFSGFDGLARKLGFLGRRLQKFFHFMEKTPLHFFGISHLIVVKKFKQ